MLLLPYKIACFRFPELGHRRLAQRLMAVVDKQNNTLGK
jgi:hypothetical protein